MLKSKINLNILFLSFFSINNIFLVDNNLNQNEEVRLVKKKIKKLENYLLHTFDYSSTDNKNDLLRIIRKNISGQPLDYLLTKNCLDGNQDYNRFKIHNMNRLESLKRAQLAEIISSYNLMAIKNNKEY